MKKGKYIRTPEMNQKNSLALKRAGIKPPSRLGTKISEKHKEKIRAFMKGKTFTKNKKISETHKQALVKSHLGKPLSIEHRKRVSEAQKGRKAHNWKGGVSPINTRIRMSIEYRLWREAVFARDNWTCQKCGKRGGNLHPHHIKEFAKYPELRFAIDNGQTLCRIPCHQSKHKTRLR